MGLKLSILIPTLGEREKRFLRLVSELQPQVQKYNGDIEVLVYWNNFERPLAEIRQALVEKAKGDYVCFIDDDDAVPSYYCDRIMTALESGPDYIGWQMQLWINGVKTKPTFHSLDYDRWWDDNDGYYRNASHLNPVKRSIAIQVPFHNKDGAEDYSWACAVAPLLHTEVYIDEPMYFYYFNSYDSTWQGGSLPSQDYIRPALPKFFHYHPNSKRIYRADPKRKRRAK